MDSINYYFDKVINFFTPLHAQLMRAIRQGNLSKVQSCINSGVDVNQFEPVVGTKPIICAAWNGKKEIVKLLISVGADVNATDLYFGQTALMGAANHGHTEVTDILIKAKADITLVDKDNRNALMLAVKEVCGIKSAFLILGSMNAEKVMALQNNHDINFPSSLFILHPYQTIVVSKDFNYKWSKAQGGLIGCFKDEKLSTMKSEIFSLYWRLAHQPNYPDSPLNINNTPAEIMAYLLSQRYFMVPPDIISENIKITVKKIHKMIEGKDNNIDQKSSLVIFSNSICIQEKDNIKRNADTAVMSNLEETEKENRQIKKSKK